MNKALLKSLFLLTVDFPVNWSEYTSNTSAVKSANQHVGVIPGGRTTLVGGFNHLEKYYIVNGTDYPIYYGK
jgi:hypothetical protein